MYIKRILRILEVLALSALLTACSSNPKMPNSSVEYKGQNYTSVKSELQAAGFENIQFSDLADLTSNSVIDEGAVEEVSVNGTTDYEKNAAFNKDVPIVISYHSVKKVKIPVSSDNLQSADAVTVAKQFSSAGFENVNNSEVYDLDPDDTSEDFRTEVTINNQSTFNQGDLIPYNAVINIVCHKPYTKYFVKIVIDFKSNLVFDKYDVIMSLNGESYNMTHGNGGSFDYRVKEGDYNLIFTKADDSDIKTEIPFNVHCDVEAAYQISCHSKEIAVNTLYVDNQEPLATDEVKIQNAHDSFYNKNYKEVEQTLTNWGFNNISETPLYDIIFGITDEGAVEDVSINGNNTYRRGDVYKKDATVNVSYHLPYNQDPNRETEAATSIPSVSEAESQDIDSFDEIFSSESTEAVPNLTIVNCPDLAGILSEHAEVSATYIAFSETYHGRTIEFDGSVDYIVNHNNYDTRFDMLLSAGNYSEETQIGPTFKIENVNCYDVGISSLNYLSSVLPRGSNVHIIAKVESFNSDTGIFMLDPISILPR